MPRRLRSLLFQSILWLVLPQSLVMYGVIGLGVITYRQGVISLLLDRDRQLAAISAHRVSEALEAHALVLETLAGQAGVGSDSPRIREAALGDTGEALAMFNGGVVVLDRDGRVLTAVPPSAAQFGIGVASGPRFASLRERRRPEFSDVLTDSRSGEAAVVIAVPISDESGRFAGALLGVLDLASAPLGEPLQNLIIGEDGFAYLVDHRGRVVFHPEAGNIGADFSALPSVRRVTTGTSGAMLWEEPEGERVVLGYAPVEAAGWGLVVRESWDAVVAPALVYGSVETLAGLAALLLAMLFLWRGAKRIAIPIRALAAQTARLAAGEAIESIPESGLMEIDGLKAAFLQMAAQIASYRDGVRRYVGAITQSQEDERRRIARELHDETAQSLLAVSRRLELEQASESDPARTRRLADLQGMIADTLKGVRQISRDLRPLALEDLGLVPALHALVQSAPLRNGHGPRARLDVSGPVPCLSPEQELALYRITQEALANVRKHASAHEVRVRLSFNRAAMRLEVDDDGVGFTVPASFAQLAQHDNFGLMGIEERTWAVGGQVSIQSAPGEGTRLVVTMPLDS